LGVVEAIVGLGLEREPVFAGESVSDGHAGAFCWLSAGLSGALVATVGGIEPRQR
jgi:hypothetical protein